jgi:predicted ATP-grasp superfamily ATP-dependent carboligase
LPYDVLILGASARAAAFSALRCGLRPFCADYFADGDLRAVCPWQRVNSEQSARDFSAISDSLPPTPWFYTGGFENHPELVEHISRRHPLWGADATTLRAVRNPVEVSNVFGGAGIRCPAVRLSPRGLPRDGSWLIKPIASGAGRGIKPFAGPSDVARPSHYYQERLDGPSFSALFIGTAAGARLIGVTRQLIGVAGHAFGYGGSIGPCRIAAAAAAQLQRLGNVLSASFGLAGWFGVDYVLSRGIPWPVEINPRYTASVEVHELALRRSLLEDHQRACEGRALEDEKRGVYGSGQLIVVGKLILHARKPLVAPEIIPDENETADPFAIPAMADIPEPGSRFDPGEPVLTLFARAGSFSRCREQLIRLERTWRRRLEAAPGAHAARVS